MALRSGLLGTSLRFSGELRDGPRRGSHVRGPPFTRSAPACHDASYTQTTSPLLPPTQLGRWRQSNLMGWRGIAEMLPHSLAQPPDQKSPPPFFSPSHPPSINPSPLT